MLLTIVMTRSGVNYFFKRQNDPKVLKHTVLTDDLSLGLNDALKQAMSKGWKVTKPIPTALILPLDAHSAQGEAERFKKKHANDVRVVFEDILAQSFLKGAGKDIVNQDFVILSNTGDGTEMFSYRPDGQSQLSLMPEMNYANGWEKINDHIIATFAKEGLVLGAEQEKQLLEQICKKGPGGTYSISKDHGNIRIEASIEVSKEEYEDKLSEKRTLLSRHLHPKILKASPKLKEIFVVGEYFDNQVMRDYLSHELELTAFLKKDNFIELRDMVHAASAVGFGGVGQFLQAEEAEQERIAQLQEKRKAKADRISLIQEIRETVTDPSKAEEYKRIFGKKADALGVPREVVEWNIEEIVDTLELERELGEKHEIPVVSSSSVEKMVTDQVVRETVTTTTTTPQSEPQPQASRTEPKPANNPPPAATSPTATKTKGKKIVKTAEVLDAAGEIARLVKTSTPLRSSVGYHAQLCELVSQPGEEKILRYITTDELKDGKMSAGFQRLHDVESAYYENTSPIHSADFGKYYFREAIEGEPLSLYIRKNKPRFHPDINKWSNTDLKLLLKIWKEVDSLDYKFEMDADDIVVLTKRTWSLKKEVDVKVVNFKAEEVPEAEMKRRMHKVLSSLLGEKTYNALQERFTV